MHSVHKLDFATRNKLICIKYQLVYVAYAEGRNNGPVYTPYQEMSSSYQPRETR